MSMIILKYSDKCCTRCGKLLVKVRQLPLLLHIFEFVIVRLTRVMSMSLADPNLNASDILYYTEMVLDGDGQIVKQTRLPGENQVNIQDT